MPSINSRSFNLFAALHHIYIYIIHMSMGSTNQKQQAENRQPGLKKKIKLKSILFFERKEEQHKSTKSSDSKKSNDDHTQVVTVYIMGNQKLFSYFPTTKIDVPKEMQEVCRCQGISFKEINVPCQNGQAELRVLNIEKLNALPDAVANALHIQSENKICIIAYNVANQSTALVSQCAQLWKSSQPNRKHQSCLMIVGIDHGSGLVKMNSKKAMELARKYGAIFMEMEQNEYHTILQRIELVLKSVSSTESQLHSRLKNIVVEVSTLKSKLHFLKFSPVSQLYQIWNSKIDTIIGIIDQILQIFLEVTAVLDKIAQTKWNSCYIQKMKYKVQEYHGFKKFINDLCVANGNMIGQEDHNISNMQPNQIKQKLYKIQQLIASATQQIAKTQAKMNLVTNHEQNYNQLMAKLSQQIKQLGEEYSTITQLKQKLQQSSNYVQSKADRDDNISNTKADDRQKEFLHKFVTKMILQSKSLASFIDTIQFNQQLSTKMHDRITQTNKQTGIHANMSQDVMTMLVKYFLHHKQKQIEHTQNKSSADGQSKKQEVQEYKQQISNSVQEIRRVISQYDVKKAQDKDYNEESLRDRLQIQQHTYKIIMDNHCMFSTVHEKSTEEYRTPTMQKKESQSNIK